MDRSPKCTDAGCGAALRTRMKGRPGLMIKYFRIKYFI